MSHHTDLFTSGRADAEKLMIPIHMPGPPQHFLGLIRFPADNMDSDHTWQFATIDSLDNDTYTAEVEDLIKRKSTLSNSSAQISNDYPDASDASATWTRVTCVKQGEAECGCRTILHFYIAAYCTTLVEFEKKIGKLDRVLELPSRVRSWAVDWLEKDNVEEPEWLRNILRG